MTLPAASLWFSFLPQGEHRKLFCQLDQVGGGSGLAASGPLSHHTQLFQDTGCTFDMCLLTLPMMPPLLPPHHWLGLSPRLTGVMVCETGREREREYSVPECDTEKSEKQSREEEL